MMCSQIHLFVRQSTNNCGACATLIDIKLQPGHAVPKIIRIAFDFTYIQSETIIPEIIHGLHQQGISPLKYIDYSLCYSPGLYPHR